ncbi:apolipoprotein N-acyltransferase [Corynebacterium sp. YIM 101645]|nr:MULTISPECIES: apolipoprotein N-acyltransferase [Corynebacterium]MCS5480585.1 apolipoprotein N-acyltransferase [Corynebacterium lemuris]
MASHSALMVGAAVAWWLALPPRGWWVLFPVGVAIFILALAGQPLRNRLWLGVLGGVVHYALALRWLTDFNTAGYVAVVAIQTLLLMLVAAVSSSEPAFRRRWPVWWLLTPAALVMLEAVQHRFPFGGFPLPAFGYSQADGPFMAAAPLGGTLLATALAAVAGAVVAAVILEPRRARGLSVVAIVVVLAVPGFAPAIVDDAVEDTLKVVLVQGGGPRGLRAVNTDPFDTTRRHLQAAGDITGDPDLVLLPENVANVDETVDGTVVDASFAELARQLDTNVVVGITESDGEHFRNASILWGPDGTRSGRYEKHHRVPFGEYLPMRNLIERLSDDARFIPRDAIIGEGPAVLDPSEAPRLGIVISYEVFFADRVADAVRNGGQLLLAPTNAASFVTEEVPAIEVAASRMRASEFGRTVLQAAPTGYSAIIQPDGTVSQLSDLSTSELLTATVPLHTGLTPYARMGDTPMLVLALLALAWPLVSDLVNWLRRRRGHGGISSRQIPSPPFYVDETLALAASDEPA